MLTWLFSIALIVHSPSDPPRLPVDRIELNHFYDDTGHEAFVQIIVWEWLPDYRRYRVRCWRLIEQPSDYPTTRHGITTATICGRQVQTRIYHETWTEYDPERLDKRLSPEHTRQPLPPLPPILSSGEVAR